MKINKSILPELIFCVEGLNIACSSDRDLDFKKSEIAKYHKYILKLTGNIKLTANIVMLCILGDAYKVLSKLRTEFKKVIKQWQ